MMRVSRYRTAAILGMVSVALVAMPGCASFKGKGKKPATMGERISVLDYERQVEAEAELQGVDVVLPAAHVNAEWNQPAGNAAGNLGHVTLGAAPQRLWSVKIGKGSDATRKLNGTPVIAENRLFTIDTEGLVSAFDATTGRPLWRQTIALKGEGTRPAFGGGVSVMGGRVFATTGFGIIAALDAATGAEAWRVRLATPLRAAPAVDGGRVFVTSQDGQLTTLSADKGEQLWEANATVEPAAILGPGAPSIALDTVVAGFPSGELFALRVENGRTAWQDQLARTGRTTALGALSGITSSPVIDRGRVFAIGNGGRMVALELATGQRVWEREFAGVNTPWPSGDWVFAVTVEGQLVALSRTDGKIRWVSDLGRWKNPKSKKGAVEWFGPVLAGDQLILVSSLGQMSFVSPQTGETRSSRKLSSAAYLPPVVANNILYVLTDDGTVTAYR
ncbi:pyrrolo-quinoline quinone [Sandaracinobacter neustonicus]|uniref:Outer membrane protein assembly factor BamB n=1 Tax=Sandaracinobacter neustonicus TaxID=1715348 RepID=A0A501XNT5_9SPHN|nr:PQQ-like beta-propeller repeat protein [Sandaracinobacter neustonicus]TPE62236.1 pyrrolo-quinoline quinone [Sandaracinobacter neustonicus]